MTIVGTAKRRNVRRHLRFDRVGLTIGIAVVVILTVRNLAHANATCMNEVPTPVAVEKGTKSYEAPLVEPSYEIVPLSNVTTTETTINVVVPQKQLATWATAEEMGITYSRYCTQLDKEISIREQQLLTMLVLSEARNQCWEAQVAVAATVLNRVESESFPDTIEGVLTQDFQFSPVKITGSKNGFYNGNSQILWADASEESQRTAREAVIAAIYGADPTKELGGCLYYANFKSLSKQELEYRKNVGKVKVFSDTTFYREWKS